jgi:predicted acetyltransferase
MAKNNTNQGQHFWADTSSTASRVKYRPLFASPSRINAVADPDDYWRSGSHVFLIKVDGNLAGFAMVTRHPSYLGSGETFLMEEFIVMRKYRRQGLGAFVARTLFDRLFGFWEVAQVRPNLPSQSFWRHVISRYTGGQYREVEVDDERWRGPVQAFTSGPSLA